MQTSTQYHRMSDAAYKQLEKQLQHPSTSQLTSPVMAGQIIGEQRVLRLLRDGFVVSA